MPATPSVPRRRYPTRQRRPPLRLLVRMDRNDDSEYYEEARVPVAHHEGLAEVEGGGSSDDELELVGGDVGLGLVEELQDDPDYVDEPHEVDHEETETDCDLEELDEEMEEEDDEGITVTSDGVYTLQLDLDSHDDSEGLSDGGADRMI